MKKSYLAVLALVACLSGCVPVDSLNPIYTDKDIVFDESLLGYWVGPKNGTDGGLDISALDGNGKKAYRLTMFDQARESGGNREQYHAYLVNLGGRQFLDVVPEGWNAHSGAYALQIKLGKSGTSVEPRLLRLGASSYLEFSEGVAGDAENVQANLRPAHWVIRLTRKENGLMLDWMDAELFTRAAQAGKVRLANVMLQEGNNATAVVTASTADLQKFVVEHADDATIFNNSTDELHRKK